MSGFDHLETPLDEAPLFIIEQPDSDRFSELDRQARFIAQLRKRNPSIQVIAIPNAAQRGQKALNQVRREGAVWGAPDLIVLHRGKTAFIEFKNGTAMPKQHQTDCLNALHRNGFPCGVFRTAEAVIVWLRAQGFEVGA